MWARVGTFAERRRIGDLPLLRGGGGAPCGGCMMLAAAALILRFKVASGQIYAFENVLAPTSNSLSTLYPFYVFSYEEAPERKAQPFVKFSGFAAQPTAGASMDNFKDYEGLQLSLVLYRDFFTLIDPQHFCSLSSDVAQGIAAKKDQLLLQKQATQTFKDVDVYTHEITFSSDAASKDVRMPILHTGVYILVFSNCGTQSDATVSGSVVVKNAYGFLPGNVYHKLPFYGWLLVVYVGLAVIWMFLSVRWWAEFLMIQKCIGMVISLGISECFLWFVFYSDWNNSGTRGEFVFVLAIIMTSVKATLLYMLVLVASLGWGVTRPYLDNAIIVKILVLSLVYIVLDVIREIVLWHSPSMSVVLVLLCLLQVSLLLGPIFSWVFIALHNLLANLKELRQFEDLLLFQRFWRILVAAYVMTTSAGLVRIFIMYRSIDERWRYSWFITDGVPPCLLLFVLVAMMFLWKPNKYSQRAAHSMQLPTNGDTEAGGQPVAICADEDALDANGDGNDSFWATSKDRGSSSASNPRSRGQVIGAKSAE